MRIGLIDNYDSFTYNLVHYIEPYVDSIEVFRNDRFELNQLNTFDALVLSPGPGLPRESGSLMRVIDEYAHSKPILGICLGLQAIVEHFGGSLTQMNEVRHGQMVIAQMNTESHLFKGLQKEEEVGLYHSWGTSVNLLPDVLKETAVFNGITMAIEHCDLPISAVQFHPESVLTQHGKAMILNWINYLNDLK